MFFTYNFDVYHSNFINVNSLNIRKLFIYLLDIDSRIFHDEYTWPDCRIGCFANNLHG